MPKPGSGKPASRHRRSTRSAPSHVPGVPGFPVKVTFAVREPIRWGVAALGALVGAVGAVPVWRLWGVGPAVMAGASGLILGLSGALLWRRERCVEPGCGAPVKRGARVCAHCGGTFIGRLEMGSDGSND